jgi:hypothetical protein
VGQGETVMWLGYHCKNRFHSVWELVGMKVGG